MWTKSAQFILRYRLPLLIFLIASTVLMGFLATKIELSYTFSNVIPETNPIYQEFSAFQKKFGEDGNVMVMGVQTDKFFQLDFFNDWFDLGNSIKLIDGIDEVISPAHVFILSKNPIFRKFEFAPLVKEKPKTQEELDSLKNIFLSLPLYQSRILNSDSNVALMGITFNKKKLNSQNRISIVNDINELTDEFARKYNIDVHRSGLPFIRSVRATLVAHELRLFVLLAMLISAIILFAIFRSGYAVIFPLLMVVICVIWSMATMVILGFKVTILTGIIPALIIVIGIPNCVYLLNKYYGEYKKHNNRMKALSRVISRVGIAVLFSNLTTAVGFGVFYLTKINILEEFGLITGINIMIAFIISLVAIPIIFSYLPEPKSRHTIFLDSKIISYFLNIIDNISHFHRRKIYAVTFVLVIAAGYGITLLKGNGFMFDDVPKRTKEYKDLKFFEKHFNGVMPFEIVIDMRKKGGAMVSDNIDKIEAVQDSLTTFKVFSKSLSFVDGMKYANQVFYNGNPSQFRVPNDIEKSFIISYLNKSNDNKNLLKSFLDSTKRYARISLQMADIGSHNIPALLNKLKTKVDAVFDPVDYDVIYTGTSIVALAGYEYLINSLLSSLGFSLIINAMLMLYLFRSMWMLGIALIPNLIPLLITAASMGYFGITLKPSTVLIFSIAFGISVDETIQFLTKYKQELLMHNWDISKTVSVTLRETGMGIIHSGLILFFGFFIFTASDFTGTFNMGLLVGITLIVAMLCNLVLLPCLLLSFEKHLNRQALKNEPLVIVYDEEEDVDLEKLDFGNTENDSKNQ